MKRVIRIISIRGDKSWVDMVLERSYLQVGDPVKLGAHNVLEELVRGEATLEESVKIQQLIREFNKDKGGDNKDE